MIGYQGFLLTKYILPRCGIGIIADVKAALELLHATGWSWADVRGAIGVPHMGTGSLFLSAEATVDEAA